MDDVLTPSELLRALARSVEEEAKPPSSLFDAAAEKRIKHIVYCAEQLMAKRLTMWQTRYERAIAAAQTVAELDEAMLRVNAKYPHLGLGQIVEAQQ
jgi:acyl transferase domain-containing protein